jgi:nitroreductase
MNPSERFSMPLGEAIFTQRAIRRLKPDSIPDDAVQAILEAAIRAPSASNKQPWHFLVVRDAEQRRRLGEIYHDAWWAKRRDAGITGPEQIAPDDRVAQSAMRLADHFGEAPIVVLVCAESKTMIDVTSVIPATQNLLLAARALGIGGTITSLHPSVAGRMAEAFGIPEGVEVVYCVPLGYPQGNFGPTSRKPLADVTSLDRWGEPLA